MVKNLLANAKEGGDMDLIPWSGRQPGEGKDNPLQSSCLEKSHGQRGLAWNCKESDVTEHAQKHPYTIIMS